MYKNIFSKKLALFILGGVLCKRVTTNYFKFMSTDYFNKDTQNLNEYKQEQSSKKASMFSKYLLNSLKSNILVGSNTLFFLLNIFKEKSIINCEPVKKPYLGCSIRAKDEGMQVILIKSDSPAERAGLMVKDIILEIDGNKVTTINDFNAAVGNDILRLKDFRIRRKVNEREVIFNLEIQLTYNE
jgi:predicted metalloprotease with PDZ domain